MGVPSADFNGFQTPCSHDELVRTPYHLEPDAGLPPSATFPDHPTIRREDQKRMGGLL